MTSPETTSGTQASSPVSSGAAQQGGVPLGSTPASDAFAQESVMPAMSALAVKAEAASLTTAEFVDALINVQAAYLTSILGPKVTGDMLQALGRHVAAQPAETRPA